MNAQNTTKWVNNSRVKKNCTKSASKRTQLQQQIRLVELMPFHELGVYCGTAICFQNVMFVYIHTYAWTCIYYSNSVKHPEGMEIPAQTWIFRYASFIFNTRAHKKLQLWQRLGKQGLLSVLLNFFLFLPWYLFERWGWGARQLHTSLSDLQRALKTCLGHIIYAAFKNSRNSNGAQRPTPSSLHPRTTLICSISFTTLPKQVRKDNVLFK